MGCGQRGEVRDSNLFVVCVKWLREVSSADSSPAAAPECRRLRGAQCTESIQSWDQPGEQRARCRVLILCVERCEVKIYLFICMFCVV